ncbi:MAG: acetyl-CoA carboxylase biotin carboxylase subunit [Bacteroidales bacterium]|nr:acetyl-CoA carboxylase biotin carboxylase subunit [Bacteroidales bacterium]MCF8338136.1 acetyl-CoA carboxylase biotin carboxylase subunit [Bacteroidales bacterium]
MIEKVLVANRGEIAMRIMRSCREMDIRTVGIYSDADRTALHVRYADEAYHIGKAPSSDSYLHIEKIIAQAKESGVDAIHPGYGFLSENATFSKRCQEEGILFIGPDPMAIETMGDKITARKTMKEAGVPVVPGTAEPIKDESKVVETIHNIGLPVMIKASAGGGGKGMRLVMTEEEILPAVRSAKSEARESFGDDSVYIEKYIKSPHHIEFQILEDKQGNAVHLFERECSVQRRHQKVVEETPSPIMTPEVREKMGRDAVNAAKAVNYRGAGTVEFVTDDNLNYYFLEMNTRLQVEHPITELVVGIDLVKEQLAIADGKDLSVTQKELTQKGHAIECRIYAEDPNENFRPSPGKVKHITEPMGQGVRVDGYVYEGYEIPIHYDPMISKLVVWGLTRKESIERMRRSLYEYKITGVKTSIGFLEKVMKQSDFIAGNYNTNFISHHWDELMETEECGEDCEQMAIIAALVDFEKKQQYAKSSQNNGQAEKTSYWKYFGRQKNLTRI